MTNHSEEIKKKRFYRQVTVPPYKLYCAVRMWKKDISHSFYEET